jgi:hypothetical protein
VTAAPSGASALPPSAPNKAMAQATRRLGALEERLQHLEDSLNQLVDELKGTTTDGLP